MSRNIEGQLPSLNLEYKRERRRMEKSSHLKRGNNGKVGFGVMACWVRWRVFGVRYINGMGCEVCLVGKVSVVNAFDCKE